MSKKMLINASHPEENRVAIVVDGLLHELDIELAGQEHSKGNIYKAVVVRVETGLQAAFVDYGAEKLGFLQIGEIHPSLYPDPDSGKKRPRIAEILKRGQEILVQVVKEERGTKGAALTTYLSLPGRYMVLMPDSDTKGVSRKINEESERRKLKKTMNELELPEQMGYIVRTAGIGKDKEELKRDFDYLVRLYEGILDRKDQIKAPAQLYQESSLAIRSIRDYFSADMDEVLIDDQQVYQDAKDFFALVMPEQKHLVKRHRERRPIFSRYQIEEQIEGLSRNQIPLNSGGSIVIDQTEALVAIDVNSGKMSSESGIEATALKTNLEAAAEVGRQLRLRDLGGLIVIDFIDMRERKHIREIEQEVRKAFKYDKARVSVGRISQFGLLEMSRQRLKPTLSVGAFQECPHCTGSGKIPTIEAQSVSFLRQAHTAAARGQVGAIEAVVPLEVANYLLNQKRDTIIQLERQLDLRMSIVGRSDLLPGNLELETRKREKSTEESRQIMPVSHANQIEIALAAAQEGGQENGTEAAADTEGPAGEATAAAEAASSESEGANKKRRRRRRKKPAAKPTPEQDTAAVDSAPPAVNASTADTPRATGTETDPKETSTARAAATDSEVTVPSAAAENVTADSRGKESPSSPSPARSSRRSRRGGSRSKTAADPQQQVEDHSTDAPEEKKPRRPRKASQPTSPPEDTASESATTTESDSSSRPASRKKTAAADDTPPSEPARPTGRSRTNRGKTQSQKTAEADRGKSTETAASGTPKTAPKSGSRRPTAPQSASEDAFLNAEAVPADSEQPGETATTAATKPRAKTPRRSSSKKAAEQETTAAAPPVEPAPDAVAEPPRPKPRKPRTPRKTETKAVSPAAESGSADAPETAEKPHRKSPARNRKKTTPTKESVELNGSEENAGETKKKTGPPRRTARKKPTAKKTESEVTPQPD